jgi:outer membrane receptor protein involved in Fe transport
MDNDWQAFIRADFRYIDEQPIDYQASAYRDSTSLANLRVGLTTASKWEFTVFANNLFDTAPSLGPYTFGSTVGGGRRPTDFTVRPRTLGLRISRDF